MSQLTSIIHEYWEFELRENPLFATTVGDRRYNHLLPEVSQSAFMRRKDQIKHLLDQLEALDRNMLSSQERINGEILERILWGQSIEIEFGSYYLPFTQLSGPHTSLPDVIEITPFQSISDYRTYFERLKGFPEYIHQMIQLAQRGLQLGFIPARDSIKALPDSLSNILSAAPSESVFFQPFLHLTKLDASAEARQLADRSMDLLGQEIYPQLRDFRSFIQEEYLPSSRHEPGIASLPGGLAYYADCIRRYTNLEMSAQQVHDTGLAEVQRIRKEMQALIFQLGFRSAESSEPIRDFIQAIRSDARFYVSTPEELLGIVALILKRMDGELPRLFSKLPRTPYGIRQVPEHTAPFNTTAYYFPPAGDLSTAGFYYVNTYDLKSRPLYDYEALSFHEAVPGHHLQIAIQMELQNVPPFRRFADMTAFMEGWALYAERLGLETGFYQDPYSNFGRLTYEMWRACRLVVDTGMHAFGWTRHEAVDFMAENTALSQRNIENEVDRYIGWPGQALAYKIGELKIRALRKEAETVLGSSFNLRHFHDILLEDGAIPLDILEKKVHQWITSIHDETSQEKRS
jgi:uncharacterized protein (DUF885 family)